MRIARHKVLSKKEEKMPKLKIEIDTDIIARDVNSWEIEEEICRILREVESDIMDGETAGLLTDIDSPANDYEGSAVGTWGIN